MKFRKLPKEKRNQLVMVVVATLLILAVLGFGLIQRQYENLTRLADKKAVALQKLQDMEKNIKNADRLVADVAELNKALSELETNMATGDPLSWFITSVKKFRTGYKVEIPTFGPSWNVADVNLLTKFPYKQLTISVAGTAYYHDLGRFIADYENTFPHSRVCNLDLDLNPSGTVGEREKLSFRMDIVTLVKPNPL